MFDEEVRCPLLCHWDLLINGLFEPKADMPVNAQLMCKTPFMFKVHTFHHLVFLADLSKNRLSEIPPEVCLFAPLESLSLYHNCIKCIPEAIINLQMMTYLDLRWTRRSHHTITIVLLQQTCLCSVLYLSSSACGQIFCFSLQPESSISFAKIPVQPPPQSSARKQQQARVHPWGDRQSQRLDGTGEYCVCVCVFVCT